jgi:phage baseplate assembly protein W
VQDPERAFLGTGWTFPPTFSRAANAVVMVSADADIRQSLWVLFTTAPGERVMLETYGCDLWRMVFTNLTATVITQIGDAVRMAVLNWEPRIDVDAVEVSRAPDQDGLISITVAYTVRHTNSRSNLVFPFYLREGTLVPASDVAA